MCCVTILDETRTIEFRRNNVILDCERDTYLPGETITAVISDSSGEGLFVFEVQGGDASILDGRCDKSVRKATSHTVNVIAPTDGSDLSLLAAWGTESMGQVSIALSCTLQGNYTSWSAPTTDALVAISTTLTSTRT